MEFWTIINIIQGFLWIWWAIWFLASYKGKIDIAINKLTEIDKKTTGVVKFSEDLSNYFHSRKIKDIPDTLKNFGRYYVANSPVKLTEKGEEFITESGFAETLKQEWWFLIDSVSDKLKSKLNDSDFFYFAEEFSIQVVNDMFKSPDSSIFNNVRKYIFNHGLGDVEDQLIKTLGIYVRDIVIEKNWKTAEFKAIQK